MGLADAAPLVEVDLPHDAMIHGRRSPDALTAEGQGWYEAEDLEYMKTFVVAADDQGKAIWLEFEGAYMNTTVCQPSSFRYNSDMHGRTGAEVSQRGAPGLVSAGT